MVFRSMYRFVKEIPVTGLRYPRIFGFEGAHYLVGSKAISQVGDMTKYMPFIYVLGDDLLPVDQGRQINVNNIVSDVDRHEISVWVRDITVSEDIVTMLIEFKENLAGAKFVHHNFIVWTSDLCRLSVSEECRGKTFLFAMAETERGRVELESTIEPDLEMPDFIWGKYLFRLREPDGSTRPMSFDSVVDYSTDKGHVLHGIRRCSPTEHRVLFSIRRHTDGEHHYDVCEANTQDFVDYHDTEKSVFDRGSLDSDWFSYPSWFSHMRTNYLVCNTDDFGKASNPVIFVEVTK
jgi:hypothetical protein